VVVLLAAGRGLAASAGHREGGLGAHRRRFALQSMDQTETADLYELVVERHQKNATILTSNRDPSEWIGLMSDPLLAQSAVDGLVATS